ncbi:hypothetical protein BDR26DRAFT_877803 [Obelidium mucronatum]|nr:hypothetical protein BDR26DRAFT_877803 [Obelidium mucronatum]
MSTDSSAPIAIAPRPIMKRPVVVINMARTNSEQSAGSPGDGADSYPDDDFRLGLRRSSLASSSLGRRARSVVRGDDDEEAATTLASLQAAMSTLSRLTTSLLPQHLGFLYKLHASTDTSASLSSQWKHRFLVLAEDGNLYLFRANCDPLARPITHLPLSNVISYQDGDGSFIIKVQGDDGFHVSNMDIDCSLKRCWTLKCQDDQTCSMWISSINRVLEERQRRRGSASSGATTLFNGDSLSNSPVGSGGSPPKGGAGVFRRPSRSGSQDYSSRPSGPLAEEREAKMRQMHQEYLQMQMSLNAEKFAARKQQQEEAAANASISTPSTPTDPPTVSGPSLFRRNSTSKKYRTHLGADLDMVSSSGTLTWG